jgi:hypothetical protein
MFQEPKPNTIPNWECVLQHNDTIYIEMVKAFLNDSSIPSQILSKSDSAYSLNVGLMAQVFLYVPKEFIEEARKMVDDFQSSEIDDSEEND